MIPAADPTAGQFCVTVDLANELDIGASELRRIPPEKIRRVQLSAVVNSGAPRLVIPASVAEELGLPLAAMKALRRYPDGRTAIRPITEYVRLSYGGRSSVFNAVVDAECRQPLMGAIVLEELDFLVDAANGQLVPRDPNGIISDI